MKDPTHGYVEWQDEGESPYRKFGFRIVHHALYSPKRGEGKDCYYSKMKRGGDLPLTDFLGVHGVVELTSFVDIGEEFENEYSGPRITDLREWTILFRRLQVPLYEEARQYFSQARDDSNLGGANEVYFYLPDGGLEEILDRYAPENPEEDED